MLQRAKFFILFAFLGLFGLVLGAYTALAAETLIRTDRAINITSTSATLEGFLDTNNDRNVEVWFEWDTSTNGYDFESPRFFYNRSSGEDFQYSLNNLRPDTTYYFRAMAENDDGDEFRGARRSFRTDDDNFYSYNYDYYYDYNYEYQTYQGGSSNRGARVETRPATIPTDGFNYVVLNGYVETFGNATIRWFEWGTSRNFLSNSTIRQTQGTFSGNFNQTISGLDAGNTYYYRAVAQSTGSPVYGEVFYVTTRSRVPPPPVYVPPANTTPITVPVTTNIVSPTVQTITIPIKINPIVETPASVSVPLPTTSPTPSSGPAKEDTGDSLQGNVLFGENFLPSTLIGWTFLMLLVAILVLVAQKAFSGVRSAPASMVHNNHASSSNGHEI